MNKNAMSSFASWLKTVIDGLEKGMFENEITMGLPIPDSSDGRVEGYGRLDY